MPVLLGELPQDLANTTYDALREINTHSTIRTPDSRSIPGKALQAVAGLYVAEVAARIYPSEKPKLRATQCILSRSFEWPDDEMTPKFHKDENGVGIRGFTLGLAIDLYGEPIEAQTVFPDANYRNHRRLLHKKVTFLPHERTLNTGLKIVEFDGHGEIHSAPKLPPNSLRLLLIGWFKGNKPH